MSVEVVRETRGWSVIVHHANGRQSRVGTYTSKFRAVEHAARINQEETS
jgi:hypothetical protein